MTKLSTRITNIQNTRPETAHNLNVLNVKVDALEKQAVKAVAQVSDPSFHIDDDHLDKINRGIAGVEILRLLEEVLVAPLEKDSDFNITVAIALNEFIQDARQTENRIAQSSTAYGALYTYFAAELASMNLNLTLDLTAPD